MAAALLKAADLHVVRRFSYGANPALAAEVKAAGGAKAWWLDQLSPSAIDDPEGNALADWFPNLWYSPTELWQRSADDIAPAWRLMVDFSSWTMARRAISKRQLLEVMVEFWSNLLHVPLGEGEAWAFRIDYDRVIRKHALGRFDQMLPACIVHNAMGLHLDNATSTKLAPNENLGRELLELHSVGLAAGYTEADVQASAKMLTGYRVDTWPDLTYGYQPEDHYVGPLTIMGFSDANADADGRAATKRYLQYLARHPKTATRIARRLCVKFVSDAPSEGLVNAVAKTFRNSGTDIKATLKTLIEHPEFAASRDTKVRTPLEDMVATLRALEIGISEPPEPDDNFFWGMHWRMTGLGNAPYSWPAPNGYPEVNGAWSAPGRVFGTFNLHHGLALRWWENDADVTYPALDSYLPAELTTYENLIKTVAKRMLGRAPNAALKQSIATRADVTLSTPVPTPDWSWAWRSRIHQIMISVLDSPQHMVR